MEFPAESLGLMAKCPYCRKDTELTLAVPEAAPTIPRKAVVLTIITVLILGLGLWGSLAALKRAERWSAEMKGKAGATNAAPARR
jgi:hypothetical protein